MNNINEGSRAGSHHTKTRRIYVGQPAVTLLALEREEAKMQSLLTTLRVGLLCGTAIVAAGGAAYAADLSLKDEPMVEEARKLGVSFTAAATTDYVFRGISQTAEEGALQASVDITYGILYAGIWGSNIDFGPGTNADGEPDPSFNNPDLEIDFYAGIKPTYGPLTFDLGFIYYYYPSADTAFDADYYEFKAGVSGTFHTVGLGATVFYSPEYTGETGEAWTVEGTAAKTFSVMGKDVTLSGLLGYTDVDLLTDYVYWNVGLSKTWSKFTFDVRYHDTDLEVGEFGCGDEVFSCDERVVGTVKVTLP